MGVDGNKGDIKHGDSIQRMEELASYAWMSEDIPIVCNTKDEGFWVSKPHQESYFVSGKLSGRPVLRVPQTFYQSGVLIGSPLESTTD